MSSNVRAQDVLDRLTSSSALNALSKGDLSAYDADMGEYEYVFEQPEVDAYLGIKIDQEFSYRLSLELNQWGFEFEDKQKFLDNISLLIDLLDSDFLHKPTQTIPGVLLGFDSEKGVLYQLMHSCSVDILNPEEQKPTIMQSFDRSPSDIKLGELKAISQSTLDGTWIGSIYVFENGAILIIDAKDHCGMIEEDIENNVVPFVYDEAYIDYLADRSEELDLIYTAEDVPPEIVSRSV